MAQQIVILMPAMSALTTPAAMAEASSRPLGPPSGCWLVRPRSDGGSDYVSFSPSQGAIEVRQGSHLPPQLPLLKWRSWLGSSEAEACRRTLMQDGGFCPSEPLF